MAVDKRVSQLTAETSVASGDFLYFEDISADEGKAITPADFRPQYWATAYGADPTGLTDSTAAIQAAIDAAGATTALSSSVPGYTWITGIDGGVVYFSRGWYRLDGKLTLNNHVSLRGESVNSTGIVASTGFTDTVMVDCVDGSNPIFDSRIEDIRLHANNNANIDQVVHAQAWQERCGLFRMAIDGYQGEGILISDVSGAAASLPIQYTTFGGFSNNTAAIHVDDTVPNAFQLIVDTVTVNPSGVATTGINCEKGRTSITNYHVENATHGIYLEDGTHYLQNITGGGTVVNLVSLDGSFPGRVRAFMLDANGGSGNTWNDLSGGTDYTGFKAFVSVGAD